MKKIRILLIVFAFSFHCFAQNEISDNSVSNNLIVNVISPGLDYELAVGRKSLISLGIGVGYSGSYEEITAIKNNGFNYVIAPFAEMQYKYLYNRDNRLKKRKVIAHNSGNFVSFRIIRRGPSIAANLTRTNNIDFSIGPTWGLQRSFKKNLRLLFDIGPQYYFDTLGNGGVFPIMVQVNLGFSLSH